MRNKLIKYQLRIFLIIIIAIFLLQIALFEPNGMIKNNLKDDKRNLKESNFWVLTTKIHIDNNWTATNTTFGWCTGSGTLADPYIIENVTIDAQDEGSCIYIENTVEYFIIQNCTLMNSEASPNAAIRLDFVSNGKILDNNITNNNGRAVSFFGGGNNIVEWNYMVNNGYGVTLSYSNGNKIINNYMQDCEVYGIYLWSSDNNFISQNEIKHCGYSIIGGHGIYISESGSPSYVDSVNNTIVHNHVDNSRKSGIYINSCDNNTIFGNVIENNLDYGIFIDDSDDINIIGNRIQFNPAGCISTQTSLNTREEWNVCDYMIDPFIIDEFGGGNFTWDELSQFAWCTGNGSYSNPYIIESVLVDAKSIGSCIRIKNSYNKYFIIKNCLIMNAQGSGSDAGIRFDWVNNGTILNCEIIDNYVGVFLGNSENITIKGNSIDQNPGQGIVLFQSKKNYIIDNEQSESRYYGLLLNAGSNNNTVRGNLFKDNTGAVTHGDGIRILNSNKNRIVNNTFLYNERGIRIEDNSHNNTITLNILLNNSNYGALVQSNPRESIDNLFYLNTFDNPTYNAYDNGTNTEWDNGLIGNYWSDYGGIDVNDDGIGDSPYSILGTGTTGDQYPIWDDGDSINPIINILSPLNNSKYNITSPNYSISIIEENLDTYYYEISGTTGVFIQMIDDLSGTINQTLWDALPEGIYVLTFFVNDTAGNSASISITINKESVSETGTPGIPFGLFYLLIALLSIISILISIKVKYKKLS